MRQASGLLGENSVNKNRKGGFAGSDMEKGDSLSLPPDWFGFALLTVLPAAGNPLPHP